MNFRFTQQYASALEHGKQNPTAVAVFELAQQLGCEPADLASRPQSLSAGHAH